MWRGTLRCGLLLIILWGNTFLLSAQRSLLHLVSPMQSFKIDVKAGSALILSEVPDQYLDKLNNINIPIGYPGLNFSVVTRKALTGHFEFGYQLNYIGLWGDVSQQSKVYRVRTQVLENSYLFCYNLRRTDYYRPHHNLFVYYKIGAITLKNDPRLRLADGSLQQIPGVHAQKFFFSNGAAVGTGVGVGFNQQFNPNFSILGTIEFSRSSDSASDIYKINKIFYDAPNTVNKYMALSVGMSYTFNLIKPKNDGSQFFRGRSETEKRLVRSKIQRQKKRSIRKRWS